MVAKGTTKASDAKKDAAKKQAAAVDDQHQIKGDVVAAAHKAVAQAEARRKENEDNQAATADKQFVNATAAVAADEEAKARGGDATVQVPDPDPHTPLSKDEQEALSKAREIVAQTTDPNQPALTEEAQERLDEAKDLPPAARAPGVATPGASATNPVLMRNDVDPEKTPPFGVGSTPYLQG